MSPKDELRRSLRASLRALPQAHFSRAGAGAAELLRASPLWGRFQSLLCFFSMKDEIDTTPLLQKALTGGKRVFAPAILGEGLGFYRIFNTEDRRPGPAGTWEPAGKSPAPLGAGDFPALVITPGLGFDLVGGRLGRGRAYYDRFFAGLAEGRALTEGREAGRALGVFALGFCLEAQLVPRIPMEAWDWPMDGLCTESRCLT